ncbi:hypothetical protein [Paraburkholderia sp. RL17-337-BIB-A]
MSLALSFLCEPYAAQFVILGLALNGPLCALTRPGGLIVFWGAP